MNDTELSAESSVTNDNDDPVAVTILTLLTEMEPGKTLTPETAARRFAEGRRRQNDPPELWRRYLNAVRQQAIHLARAGRIEILRKGKPVDPNDFKGVYRLRLKADG